MRGLVLLLIVISGYLIFEFGRISAGYDVVDAAKDRQAYQERIKRLDDEIVDIKQDVA